MTEQKTHSKAETFSEMFRFQKGIFNNALENLSEEAALVRASGNSNHMNWLLGHILHCRYMLASMIGVAETNPFGKLYWTAIENKPYPTVSEVSSYMDGISKRLIEKLSSISDDQMETSKSQGQPALSAIVSFFAYHEAYHLGQVGIVRKIVGLGPLKSN